MAVSYDNVNNRIKISLSKIWIVIPVIVIILCFGLLYNYGMDIKYRGELDQYSLPRDSTFGMFFWLVVALGVLSLSFFFQSLRKIVITKINGNSWIVDYREGFLGRKRKQIINYKVKKMTFVTPWRISLNKVIFETIDFQIEGRKNIKVIFHHFPSFTFGRKNTPRFYNSYIISFEDKDKIASFFKINCNIRENF